MTKANRRSALLRGAFASQAKLVALPPDGEDVAVMLRVRFYFLPQAAYDRIDPTCLLLITYVCTPKPLFHNRAACTELLRVVIDVLQHIEFRRAHSNLSPVDPYLTVGFINRYSTRGWEGALGGRFPGHLRYLVIDHSRSEESMNRASQLLSGVPETGNIACRMAHRAFRN